MVQKSFGIYSEDLSDCLLFIETGNEYIACCCKQNDTKQIKAFELFSFTQTDTVDFDNLLKQVQKYSRLLTESFEKVYCIWTNEKCVCIPDEFYNDEIAGTYMQTIFGNNVETTFYKENLNGLIILAALQQNEASAIQGYYTIDANVHKYFQLLKAQQNTKEGNRIHLVFYPTYFIASVFKDAQLNLIQSFPYRVPEDALYHVMRICNTFGFSHTETNVYACGLIDPDSSLYQVFYSYINNFSFERADNDLFAAAQFHEYPLHYFTAFCQYDV